MKNWYRKGIRSLFLISSIWIDTLNGAFDRSLFYRASSFWSEPRLAKNLFTTLEFQLSGGGTSCGRNGCKEKTDIFSIYGCENIAELNHCSKLPKDSIHHPSISMPSCLLNGISLHGLIDVVEVNSNYYQNICSGLFYHVHIPFTYVQLYPCGYRECITEHEHKTLDNIEKLLKKHGLSQTPLRKTGLGDSSFFLGGAYTYDNAHYLDFIDIAAQVGILFPTGKKKRASYLFDIPYGYNGHWGATFCIDIALGAFDWITIGTHVDGVLLNNHRQCLRMRTTCTETGLIKLSRGVADVHGGSVWRTGAYIKADHCCGNLSGALAFTYEQKQRDRIYPHDTDMFTPLLVNSDEGLKKWCRSIIHFMIGYEFSREDRKEGLYIELFFNKNLTGKRIFLTNMAGGLIALNIAWVF
jgi:hypothetical protein